VFIFHTFACSNCTKLIYTIPFSVDISSWSGGHFGYEVVFHFGRVLLQSNVPTSSVWTFHKNAYMEFLMASFAMTMTIWIPFLSLTPLLSPQQC